MKTAIIAMPLDRLKTGLGRYILRFIKSLSELHPDLNITIFCLNRDKKHFSGLPDHWEIQTIADYYEKPLANHFWHWKHSNHLADRFDMVYYPAINRRAPRSYRRNQVGFLHDLAEYHIESKYGLMRNILVKKYLKKQSLNFERIFTNSQATAEDLIRYYEYDRNKTIVNHLAVSRKNFFPDKSTGLINHLQGIRLPFILYVSRLEHPAKNHLSLLSMFHTLKKTSPDLQLVFVGSKWTNWQAIHNKIKSHPNQSDILHFQELELCQLRQLYSHCSLYIHPSLWEGFGYPILEAALCKAPVLANNEGGSLPELVPGKDFLYTTESEGVQKAQELLTNEDKRQKQIDLAWEFAQRFTEEKHLEVFLDGIKYIDTRKEQ